MSLRGWSRQAREHSHIARQVRVRLGETAYQEYKRTGVKPFIPDLPAAQPKLSVPGLPDAHAKGIDYHLLQALKYKPMGAPNIHELARQSPSVDHLSNTILSGVKSATDQKERDHYLAALGMSREAVATPFSKPPVAHLPTPSALDSGGIDRLLREVLKNDAPFEPSSSYIDRAMGALTPAPHTPESLTPAHVYEGYGPDPVFGVPGLRLDDAQYIDRKLEQALSPSRYRNLLKKVASAGHPGAFADLIQQEREKEKNLTRKMVIEEAEHRARDAAQSFEGRIGPAALEGAVSMGPNTFLKMFDKPSEPARPLTSEASPMEAPFRALRFEDALPVLDHLNKAFDDPVKLNRAIDRLDIHVKKAGMLEVLRKMRGEVPESKRTHIEDAIAAVKNARSLAPPKPKTPAVERTVVPRDPIYGVPALQPHYAEKIEKYIDRANRKIGRGHVQAILFDNKLKGAKNVQEFRDAIDAELHREKDPFRRDHLQNALIEADNALIDNMSDVFASEFKDSFFAQPSAPGVITHQATKALAGPQTRFGTGALEDVQLLAAGGNINDVYVGKINGQKVIAKQVIGMQARKNVNPANELGHEKAAFVMAAHINSLNPDMNLRVPEFEIRDEDVGLKEHSKLSGKVGIGSFIESALPGNSVEARTGVNPLRKLDNEQIGSIALFDAIIGNYDRHGNNYMVDKKGAGDIHLIDHGLSFPEEDVGVWGNHIFADEAQRRRIRKIGAKHMDLLHNLRGQRKELESKLGDLLSEREMAQMFKRIDWLIKLENLPTAADYATNFRTRPRTE